MIIFILIIHTEYFGASLVAQTLKNPPARQEIWFRSLDWEDSLEEGMATHSSILAWRAPRTEEPGRLQSWGHTELDTAKHTEYLESIKLNRIVVQSFSGV